MPSTDVMDLAKRRRFAPKDLAASALCLVPALYCLGVMAFALYHADQYASASPQRMRYVAVPGVLFGIFAIVAVVGSRTLRLQVGGIGLAVLFALFAFETRLQLASFSAVKGMVATPGPEWMRRQGLTGGLAPSATAQTLNRHLGVNRLADAVIGGIPGKRVLLCAHKDKPVIYRADRYGFRNADTAYGRPIDAMLIGDSFVEGICLPENFDLVGRVRARRPDTVGLGTRGAGPLLELAILGRFGPELKPRNVVFVFYEGNDWENLERELRRPWLRPSLSRGADFGPARMPAKTMESVGPILLDSANAKPLGTLDILNRTHGIRNFFALQQTWAQLGLAYPKVAPEQPEYAAIIARAKAIADGWGGKTIIVYVPQTSRLKGVIPDQFVFDQVRNKVIAAARATATPLVDLTPTFLAATKPVQLYGDDGHLSARGADLAARVIDDALVGKTVS